MRTTAMKNMKVQGYKLYASNGRYIRTATKVILNDGKEIKFLDKMSKKEAVKNAVQAQQ